jgi:tetratricopeptide (TPR) repeat protein
MTYQENIEPAGPAAIGSPMLGARLNSIYFNLEPVPGMPLHGYRCEFGYRAMAEGDLSRFNIQRIMPPSFRPNLCAYARLPAYDVANAEDLPEALRSERWRHLVERVRNFEGLSVPDRATTLYLLGALGFYDQARRLVDPEGLDPSASEAEAKLAYYAAGARYVLYLEGKGDYSPHILRRIAERSPKGARIRIDAGLYLLVQAARQFNDLAAVEHWARFTRREIDALAGELTPFEQDILVSRYNRAASFEPFMKGDVAAVTAMMDEGEERAKRAPVASPEEEIVKLENLHPLLESRSKEAVWKGRPDLAEQWLREAIAADPNDPKPRIELGELLLSLDRIEEAVASYHHAIRLGPPGLAIAYFMAGHCYEQLGRPHLAADFYTSALSVDPDGIAPAERLQALCPTLAGQGDFAAPVSERIEAWVTERLSEAA